MEKLDLQESDLPADEGRKAYQERKLPDDNPYEEKDWRHDEWMFGWDTEDQSQELFDWKNNQFIE